MNKVKRLVHNTNEVYRDARKQPLLEKSMLFEAGQGKNTNGNMFALVREVERNPAFKGFDCYFSTTEDTDKVARAKLDAYGLKCKTVIRDSDEYRVLLARCKYLFTDNSFSLYFHKRDDQIYVNTWHGTPLKQLGRSNIENSITSFANVQKNMLSADYLLFPNEIVEQCFYDDYCIGRMYSGKVFEADYPRNDALNNEEIRSTIRAEQGIADKRVIAYMPTWRGAKRSADIDKQVDQMELLLEDLDAMLDDSAVLYVNLHFLLGDALDYSGYTHVKKFPGRYETYDFLAACDVLITDYSSVFFDFAVTGRPIVLYPYDKDEYLQTMGTYIPYDSLPFPEAFTPAELYGLIMQDFDGACQYPEFKDRYCRYNTSTASFDILSHVCFGNSRLVPVSNPRRMAVDLRYAKSFEGKTIPSFIMDDVAKRWPSNGVLMVAGGENNKNLPLLLELPEKVPFLITVKGSSLDTVSKVLIASAKRSVLIANLVKGKLQRTLAVERDRLLPGIDVSSVHVYTTLAEFMIYVLGSIPCEKVIFANNPEYYARQRRKSLKTTCALWDYKIESTPAIEACELEPEIALQRHNGVIRAKLVTKHQANEARAIGLKGTMAVAMPPFVDVDRCWLSLRDGEPIGSVKQRARIGNTSFLSYKVRVPAEQAHTLASGNRVFFVYEGEDGFGAKVGIGYSLFKTYGKSKKHCSLYMAEDINTTMIFRRGAKELLSLAVRESNPSDDPNVMRNIRLGWLLAHIAPKRNAIVLYEKMSSRYEESASVVYENLIDAGYDNAMFILDSTSSDNAVIPEKYRKNIVPRKSLLHYWLFFSAKTFIGSEMLAHCGEVKSDSTLIAKRLADPTINYVFLQHGVMYMVSLNSESRSFFKPRKTTTGVYRVVVSSKREARHFTEMAGYEDEQLYICGLPKYDRNRLDPDADLIVVMPTWRPWEANEARIDFSQTGYYQLMEHIISAVPEELKDKLVVLPHPLFKAGADDKGSNVRQYMDFTSRYDDILQRTKLLITDYSSIAYDAFYRGAHVVFCWKDLDECMAQYGSSTMLMIDETTAFGDVSKSDSVEELSKMISSNYYNDRDQKYERRYNKIVEFHDGRNTERLMDMMKRDGLI